MKNILENPNMILYDKLPKDWKLQKLKFIAKIEMGQSPPSETYSNDPLLGIPFLQGCSEFGKKTPEIRVYCENPQKIALKNDILFSVRAPVGEINLSDQKIGIGRGLCAIRFLNHMEMKYGWWTLHVSRNSLNLVSTGTTYEAVSSEDINNLLIPLPPLSTQKAIANFLDIETSRIDSLISAKERFIGLLEEKRKATITEAVTRGLSLDVKMKDSGVEWLGKVPKHWEIERAKWLFTERNEKTDDDEGELLTVSHITGVTKRSEKDVNMFEAETTEGYKICKKGELVINTLWAWMGAMGISPVDGIASPAYHVYTLSNKLLSEYVDSIVRTPMFASEITKYSKGVWSSRLRLYPEGFFETFFAVPPLSEQKQIVDFIRKQTTRIDKLIQKTNESIELLKERRTALIGEAVTGKLKIGVGE